MIILLLPSLLFQVGHQGKGEEKELEGLQLVLLLSQDQVVELSWEEVGCDSATVTALSQCF